MGAVGGFLALAWLVSGSCTLMAKDEIELEDRNVRVRDVVSLDCLDAGVRRNVGGLVIAALPARSSRIDLSPEAIAALVRRRVPALDRIEGVSARTISTLVGPRLDAPVAQPAPCYRTNRFVAADEPLSIDKLNPTDCQSNRSGRKLRFDPAQSQIRAQTDLPEGTYLGRIAIAPEAPIAAGGAASIIVKVGAVEVERRIRVLQPAAHGQRAFVQDETGSVFAAVISENEAVQ